MSEFTSGHLMLAAHIGAVKKNAIPGSIIKQLDDKWIVYLTPNDNYLESEHVPEYIITLSNDAPVLYFSNFGDHFWGYRIFSEGNEIAYLRISYELEEELIIKTFEERYPEQDRFDYYDGEYQEEIIQFIEENGLFEVALNEMFAECNVMSFRLFNMTDEQVDKLSMILSSSNYREIDNVYSLVDEFKEIAGIHEMSYIRYERVAEDGEYESKA
ncbi:hypothetical protein ACFO9Q_13280 [Paenibacillus sp. GCM10023252]|uniref:hypothetical protein n=1 Tax=Paenibacillus sp. GCM10023252 TaxID=3252649 RepID=UPI00361F5139